MTTGSIKELQKALDLGLSIVSRVWDYQTKDWVTSVFVTDVDGDGEQEVVSCSRDGRVHVLYAKRGDLRWERVIGTKAWVSTVFAGNLFTGESIAERRIRRILVGTRDGKLFALDKGGKTISRDGEKFAYDEHGRAFDQEQEQGAYWYNTGGYTIRQVTVDPRLLAGILVGSEDRCAYGLDYETGELRWKFQTNGWVRSISACDIDGDGQEEILVGSADRYIYLLDQQGHLLNKHRLDYPIYTILASDVDKDGRIELLITTEGKELMALVYHKNQEHAHAYFEEKWNQPFSTRLLSFCVTDIDGDGNNEIIAGSDDKRIYFLDAQGNTIWWHNHKYRVFSIYPHDIDNDGRPELLIGTEGNRVRAMRVRLQRGVERKIRHHYRKLGEPELAAIPGLSADQRGLLQDILSPRSKELVTVEQAKEQMQEQSFDRAISTLLQLEQQQVELLWRKDSIGYVRNISLRHSITGAEQEIIAGTADGTLHAFNATGRRYWFALLNEHSADVRTGFISSQKREDIICCSTDNRIYMLSGPKKRKQRTVSMKDASLSSICVAPSHEQGTAEIIIGSEDKKLSIYSSDLQTLIRTIKTEEGVRIVRAVAPTGTDEPEIVTAGLGSSVHAYSWYGKHRWTYSTRDRIKEIHVKDIDHDGRVETLAGSEDRNIHVLDSAGRLLWRYLLPHSILVIDTADINGDEKDEIFVGCADSYLYVFTPDGDLLWSYQARDRIRALCVKDVDNDGTIEIALGAEDDLEFLRITNRQEIDFLLAQCWQALTEQFPTIRQTIDYLLKGEDPLLQTFALEKLAEQEDCAPDDFDILEQFVKDSPLEVRKALVRATMQLYPLAPSRARSLLEHLWRDIEQDVRTAFIEHIHLLMQHDCELAFQYLKRASDNPERSFRRLLVRTLHRLIEASEDGRLPDEHQAIFRLLLAAAQDKESEWVRQEAARTLGRFLDWHHENLIIYSHLFIVKGLYPSILRQIAHATKTPMVRNFINASIDMIDGLNEENVLERLSQLVRVFPTTADITYGKDLFLIYTELQHLFSLKTLDEIAHYQCALRESQFDPGNEFAPVILEVFNKLSQVSRPLKMYSRRENAEDRLASLLEAIQAIDRLPAFVEQKYATPLMGEPITRLPDRRVFLLLLERWRKLVQTQLNELRGKAELKAELQTKEIRDDEQVGIWLTVKNNGRSSASDVRVTLLHLEGFEITGNNIFETEMILAGEEITVEFTLRPRCKVLNLEFEIAYDDVDAETRVEKFEESVELVPPSLEFSDIPNPYSTGTPTHDRKMFYGREKDMAFLLDNLTRQARSVIVLYGQRRSGKTTMLLQLMNSPDLGDAIAVFIDLQAISYYMAIDTFLHDVAYAISEAVEQKNICVRLPELATFTNNPLHTFNLFLEEVERQLMGRKLILLIDEFEVLEDQVAKGKLRPEIFEYLRDIVQHRPGLTFLFSGTHKITEHTRWYSSVFFHIALHHRLSRLNAQGAENLIKKPVEGFLEYDAHAVKKVRDLTADQPYLLHLICRAIVDYCNERKKTFVTINDVNAVLQDVMLTSQNHFDWLWAQIKPDERVVLATIASSGREEGRWLSLKEIEENYRRYQIDYKYEYILNALKMLLDADIIEGTPGESSQTRLDNRKFRIPIGLTRIWLLNEHPLEIVRKEMLD